MEKGKFIYEGKAKQLYETDDKDLVIVHYKDDATAGNGAKKGTIHNKGVMNNEITTLIFNMLEEHGIKTHFVKKLNRMSRTNLGVFEANLLAILESLDELVHLEFLTDPKLQRILDFLSLRNLLSNELFFTFLIFI